MKFFAAFFALIIAGFFVAGPFDLPCMGVVSASAAAAKNADESDDFSVGIEELPGENWNAPWPKTTKLSDMLPAKIVEEGDGKYIYETEHFRFTATAPIMLSAIRDIARVFEGTRVANLSLPINSPCNYYQVAEKGKLQAYLYETREQYLKALDSSLLSQSAGVCHTTDKMETTTIHVPFESLGLEKSGAKYKKANSRIKAKTLAHELTHFMVNPGVEYPSWYSEGIAEYVGATKYQSGRFDFSSNKKTLVAYVTAYGNTKDKGQEGGRHLGKKIVSPYPLKTFMELPYEKFLSGDPQFSYGFSTLLVYYFFHLDGAKDAARAKEFIRSRKAMEPLETSYQKLLDGRTWQELEKDFARGMKTLGISVEFPKS